MKGQHLRRRLGFALAGLRSVRRTEASFRTQLKLAATVGCALVVLRPEPLWVAIVLLATGAVLAAEAANAAVEYLADALHP